MGTTNGTIDWEGLNQVIDAHRGQESALIEVLHRAQEMVGYLPREVQAAISEGLGVPLSKIYSVVSFYHHFTTKPKGKYQISVCKGTACYVKGAPSVVERLEKELGFKAGDIGEDGMFSLEEVRCLGACGLAPVITVNQKAYGLKDTEKAIEILKQYY